jgi:hypothetical protein
VLDEQQEPEDHATVDSIFDPLTLGILPMFKITPPVSDGVLTETRYDRKMNLVPSLVVDYNGLKWTV